MLVLCDIPLLYTHSFDPLFFVLWMNQIDEEDVLARYGTVWVTMAIR